MQAAAEIAGGSVAAGGGTVLDLTGAGAIVGVPAQAIGVAAVVHGVATGANTIHNINHDPLLNKNTEQINGNVNNAGTPKSAGDWKFNPEVDLDWRNTGKTAKEAIDEAFNKTGVPKENFEVTKWGIDKNGKTFPVEWRAEGGAEVNIDVGHKLDGPADPHVGYQTAGKRSAGGAVRGHILLDEVPYNRPVVKE